MLARLDFTRPRTIVAAAVLIGILAGLCGAIFASVVTEPRIDDAIALEEQRAADGSEDSGDEVAVDRSDQKGAGLFAAYALAGAAFGLILAVDHAVVADHHRRAVPPGGAVGPDPGHRHHGTPWLKYPPNPPAVGNPDTVGERERYYVLAIVLAALLLAGAAHLSARLRRAGWADDRRIAAVVLAALAGFGVMFAALPPSPDEVDRAGQPRVAVPDQLADRQPAGLDRC